MFFLLVYSKKEIVLIRIIFIFNMFYPSRNCISNISFCSTLVKKKYWFNIIYIGYILAIINNIGNIGRKCCFNRVVFTSLEIFLIPCQCFCCICVSFQILPLKAKLWCFPGSINDEYNSGTIFSTNITSIDLLLGEILCLIQHIFKRSANIECLCTFFYFIFFYHESN